MAKRRSFQLGSGDLPGNTSGKHHLGVSGGDSSSNNRPILEWEGVSHWLTMPRNSR